LAVQCNDQSPQVLRCIHSQIPLLPTHPQHIRIVLLATGLNSSCTVEARWISVLRLLRLGRVYRLRKVRWVFGCLGVMACRVYMVRCRDGRT